MHTALVLNRLEMRNCRHCISVISLHWIMHAGSDLATSQGA